MASIDDATDLGELFHAAFRGLRRTWSQQLAPWELTPHQWRALMTLQRNRPAPGEPVPGEPAPAQQERAQPDVSPGSASCNAANRNAANCNSGASGAVGVTRLKDLAERLRIAPRSATEVVDQLEAKGLLCREPDPTDRRAKLIVATDAGAELYNSIRAERRDKSTEYFATLNAHDRAELARILGQLPH
ncbi:MarR family transcriptional regulator [Arthrobacter sp. TMP15]|uniref:MarR family winged helix-turn-helix transcriptional regulator n=1 Tax=Arthrobacter sp. TMP15 TaxID=3140789 RepID=UPI0031BB4218